MKCFITGITGMAGSHLAEYLLSKDHEVHGSRRWRSKEDNIEGFKDDVIMYEMDITDSANVKEILGRVKPDWIFHLAAQSYVYSSFSAPRQVIEANTLGTLNMLEAIRQNNLDVRMLLAGSSEEYGAVKPEECPITEMNPLKPLSPYGVSKVAADLLCRQYFNSYGIQVIVTRAFNHSGPRRGEVFATSNFAKQIAMIEKGLQEPIIQVGNLEAIRDWTDVRDTIVGYVAAIEKGKPGEVYNICSHNGWIVGDMLDCLLKLTNKKIEIKEDPDRMRPSDVPRLIGDCSKAKKELGWTPMIPFEKTLKDLLQYWRDRV